MELAIIQPKEIINALAYASEYDSEKELLKKQKVFMHRCIDRILPDTSTYYAYYAGLQPYINSRIEIYLDIPFKSINNDSILLEYEYYKDIYKTNNSIGLINKKYLMDYHYIGLKDSDKFNNEIKNMKLNITFTLK